MDFREAVFDVLIHGSEWMNSFNRGTNSALFKLTPHKENGSNKKMNLGTRVRATDGDKQV